MIMCTCRPTTGHIPKQIHQQRKENTIVVQWKTLGLGYIHNFHPINA